ncbi:hypothetical protein Trydic_g11772 [Trypoxylus dichotomus]
MQLFIFKKLLKCNVFLYFSVLTANLATFSLGTSYAWSSPAISRLNGQIDSENNPLKRNITSSEESWIASLVPLAATISAFLSGYFADRIGRKNTLLISSVPVLAGYGFLTFANEIYYFYIGRFLCGLGCGTVFTITPIYVGEIAESKNRGTLGCFLTFLLSIGCLYIYFIAPYVSLRILSALNTIVPIIFMLQFGIFVPESPYYYVSKNQIDLARKSLLKFRENNLEIVQEELPIIVKSVQESFGKQIGFKGIFKDALVRKGFVISLGLMCFQQWSGINAVFFYMQSIFEDTKIAISSDNCVIIAGVVQLLASACTLPTIDRFGRRVLLLTSAVGNALSLFIGGIYLYLKENTSINVSSFNWLPFFALNMFTLTYTLGFGPVSFTMIGELFAPHVKSFAATVNISVCLLSVFCVTNIFPYLKESIGLGLSFILLGLICCMSAVFVYLKVPETKGKRLEEIQDDLQQKSRIK